MHREKVFGRCYDGHIYLRYDLILDQFLDNKDGLRTMKINVRIEFPFFLDDRRTQWYLLVDTSLTQIYNLLLKH